MTPRLLILACIAIVLVPANAYAYIDPGTGSFLIQGLIAAVVGVGLALKLYWRKIKAALTGKSIQDEDTDSDA